MPESTRATARLLLPVALLAFALLVPGPGQAKLEKREWLEVVTPSFVIKSRLNEKKTLALAQNLELFRQVVLVLMNGGQLASPVPTRIFVVKNASDFRELGMSRSDAADTAGFFTPSMRDNYVVLRDAGRADSRDIIQHEYVHFMMHNQTRVRYPQWFDEGMAEYLGTVQLRDGKVHIGRASEIALNSIAYNPWLPLSKVVDPERYEKWTDEDQAMFYAEAWALVHYLHTSRRKDGKLTADLGRYLELLEAGRSGREAFEEGFGIGLKRLDRELRNYLGRGRLTILAIPREVFPNESFEPFVRKLPRGEIALALGQLALHLGSWHYGERSYDRAAEYFRVALAEDENLAQAHAGLGDLLKFRGEFEQARRYFLRSWKLDDGIPETYAVYAKTFLSGERRPEKAVEMLERAEALLPSNLSIRLLLAGAYLSAERLTEARERAQSVLVWAYDGSSVARSAQDMLAQASAAEMGKSAGEQTPP
jgi:tetratricopeptide (TPR) repeat protein